MSKAGSKAGSEAALSRLEHDLIGDLEVPGAAYYGVHTVRALENFPISGRPISVYGDLVAGLAAVKQAAARANRDLGVIEPGMADAIDMACTEIRGGSLHDQFVVDVVQGGAGTSSNMNANEVIANRALELLGFPLGDYANIHPLEHVNASQSTNDVYPTAIKVGLSAALVRLGDSLATLGDALHAKGEEFAGVIKVGRTQLQDAVPMTLGQEFHAFAVMVEEDVQRLQEASQLILEVNLGGTAIGTGLNAPEGYAALACSYLAEITGIPVVPASDLVEATQDVGAFVQLSGVLKRVAVKVSKMCHDLRLLSSGPRAGLAEITLPARQAGSSIMPGKVNPVIPEVVNQIAYLVIGNDVTISFAAEAGQLQLNAFEPVIAHRLFESIDHLAAGVDVLTRLCVIGIEANVEHLRHGVEQSLGLATALNPLLGYSLATEVAQEAAREGRAIPDLVRERDLLPADTLDRLLDPHTLTRSTHLSKEPTA